MPRLLLVLPLLLSLFATDIAVAKKPKCKQPHCRFVETYIEPFYGHAWYVDAEGDRAFEYEELLATAENRIYIQRYYLTPHFWTVVNYGSRLFLDGFNSQTYRSFAEINREYYRERKAKKKGKKYNKKGVMPARAVDLIYELKSVDGLPLMRVGVRPLTSNGAATLLSKRYLTLHDNEDQSVAKSFRPGNFSGVFVAQLPDLSGLEAGDIRYSDWAFCKSCVESAIKEEGVEPFPKLNPNQFFRDNGQLPAQKFFPFDPNRISTSKKRPDRVVFGDEALAVAATFRRDVIEADAMRLARKQREAENVERYADERKAYETYVAKLSKGSLRQAVMNACGTLELVDPPNPRQKGSRLDWFESGAKRNAERYEKHVRCVLDEMDAFDYNARAAALAAAKAQLPALYEAGHYEYRSIARFVSARDEVDQLSDYLKQQQSTYTDNQARYSKAWDEMLEVVTERREAKIRKEVDSCLAGLAMTNSITANSGSYCRSMAEQGYTGLSAAVAGMQTGGSASGSAGSAASFTQPLVPEFNLSGMIANAQAVADGADASLLFNSDGTVRTTMAPEAASYQRRQSPRQTPASQPRRESVAGPAASMDTGREIADAARAATQADAPEQPPEARTPESGSNNAINITVNQTIPTPEQMAQLDRGQAPDNLSVGWGQSGATASGGGDREAPQASASRTASGGNGASQSGQMTPPEEPKAKKEPKYIWVETEMRRKGWPASSRNRAEKDFRNTLSINHLNKVCGDAYEGGDAYNGIVTTDIRMLDEAAHTTWNGIVVVGGYCRLLAHDPDYDHVRSCVSESRGQPDCAVRERY